MTKTLSWPQPRPAMRGGLRLLLNGLRKIIGHRNLNRAARALWLEARLDLPNGATINGEDIVVSAFSKVASSSIEPVLILDVGAHRGEWTELLLKALPNNRGDNINLILFEPDPDCRAFLSKKPWVDEVEIRSAALSAAEGTQVFYQTGLMAGTNSLEAPADRQTDGRRLEVRTTTIDQVWAEQGQPLILVKVDCEGHDLAVLHGASAALEAGSVAAIQFEYNHRWIPARRFLRDVYEYLDTTKYTVGKITPAGIEIASSWHPEMETYREANYLIFNRARITTLPVFPFWAA